MLWAVVVAVGIANMVLLQAGFHFRRRLGSWSRGLAVASALVPSVATGFVVAHFRDQGTAALAGLGCFAGVVLWAGVSSMVDPYPNRGRQRTQPAGYAEAWDRLSRSEQREVRRYAKRGQRHPDAVVAAVADAYVDAVRADPAASRWARSRAAKIAIGDVARGTR